MQSHYILQGRHRLGIVNGVHCILIPEVATALAEHRRNWFTQMISPARHSFATMRKRTAVMQSAWAPAAVS
ncbi:MULTISPECIES: hypothetical protein [Rhodococcus]|jgi:hypothetical protein|uniref:Uncharacterized protein n=2 Tax=Rhodococcus TaxID=1827 RepID=A0A1H7U5T1_9NOCA|nr:MULTISPECIES: hypothetical protein [Rhodococcus]AQA25817.1 hypothetical protein BTZ20_3215 [Rhodococcus sp. MTM3W5.2]MBP1159070.1 hypothetical protein [Rhodococcus sp. PvR099]MCZ4558535.1 hypothetical protein [Rhodococcus maanshanensis]PTR39057.1 hypothetical protein C8K38_116106 [Rhodococcus sp. OK611]TJZ74893.1 hypothetical protein FCG67_21230 [Rhodococcus oryzae]